MKTLSIDIETKSGADLTEVGVYRYSEDPEFAIQLFGFSVDGGPVMQVDLTAGQVIPAHIERALLDSTVEKWAHNVAFERICLSRHIGLNTCEYIDPRNWRCTMVASSYNGLPHSLEDVGKALNLASAKLEEGKDLIKFFAVRQKTSKESTAVWNDPADHPDKWSRYKNYNIRDVEVEEELRQTLKMPPETVWEEFFVAERINDRGIKVDTVLVDNAISIDQICSETIMPQLKDITHLENPNSNKQLKEWLALNDVPTDNLRSETVQNLLNGDLSKNVRRVLELHAQSSRSSNKKYLSIQKSVCSDGRIRGMFRFYGASRTGRFSGRLVQLQNLVRNTMPDLDQARALVRNGDYEALSAVYNDIPDVLSQLIRTALVPDSGLFAVSDYSAIEARVIAWLANEKWVLKAFEDGKDIYCETASRMYGCTVTKHGENSELRDKGKKAVLSCGYGGGVIAIENGNKGNLTKKEMQDMVDTWRAANPKIVMLWKKLERAAMEAFKSHIRTSVRVGRDQKIYFRRTKNWIYCDLPSGRFLAYYKPRITLNRFGGEAISYISSRTNTRVDIWGGTLAENITQALARDLLCHALNGLSDYRVVCHVHDEVIVETDTRSGEETLQAVNRIMEDNPTWAEGLPLKAEGYLCSSYRKQ